MQRNSPETDLGLAVMHGCSQAETEPEEPELAGGGLKERLASQTTSTR
jgi:hypothetical protein